MKNPWVIIGIITVVLFGGAIWYSSVAQERNNEGVEVKEHLAGNPEAQVTLVEFSDLQCPACASFEPVLKEVLAQYGDELRFEYRHFPLPIHRFAVQAAVAAEAAGQQDKFFEYKDKLFENQQTWGSSQNPTPFFLSYAEELGLDMDMFRRHMNSSILREAVRDDANEARQREVNSTPTFFLNGQRMQFQTFQQFIEQVAFAIDPSAASTSSSSAPAPTAGTGVRFGI